MTEDYSLNTLRGIIEKNLTDHGILLKKTFFIAPINRKIAGHYCTNVLFLFEKNPLIHTELIEALTHHHIVKQVDLVKGYINITLHDIYFIKRIETILLNDFMPDLGQRRKVNVEYCSVNPTGYLHIGHARNAILGDSIARVFAATNFDVTKEYYVNDGGNQIQLMAESVYSRLCELNNIPTTFPQSGYQGSEMYDVAKTLQLDCTIDTIKKHAIQFFLKQIKKDLKKLNIVYDNWVFESDIIQKQYIEKALQILSDKGFIEHNTREEKQVEKGEHSKNTLILLKTTLLGDDLDRPLTKGDGSWTYFAPDVGYHLQKIEREFEYLICVLGADHDSYAKRIKIATKLLNPTIKHYTPLCQMVSFENEGSVIKFSKRMGNSVRITDFIKEIDPEILRFMLLEKSADTQFVFNYENAINVTMKNPLFYCQYAFARAHSILRKAQELFLGIPPNQTQNIADPFFQIPEIQEFVMILDQMPSILEECVNDLTIHKLANYLKSLCEKMHQTWQVGKTHQHYRIIIAPDPIITAKRIQLIKAFILVAEKCFQCLGITAKEYME